MAEVNIETFRKSLKTGLSRELIQKIVSQYENADFNKVNTNNGTKLRDITLFSDENKTEPDFEESMSFINDQIKADYLVSKGAFLKYLGSTRLEKRKIMNKVDMVVHHTLYSRPNAISLKSADILSNPQPDEATHILTINTDGNSIASVTKAIYDALKEREIPFDIEIPLYQEQGNGFTEPIKLYVTTADLEYTIKAINSLNKTYKDKIKQPSLFNANVDNLIGYDSYLDVKGERSGDKLGVVIIKAIDKTIAELGKDVVIDGLPVVDYLRHAEHQDAARVRCLQEIKKVNPEIIDPILVNAALVIKEEKMDMDPENIFLSSNAEGELNAEFGVYNDEPEYEDYLDEEQTKSSIIDKIAEKATETAATVALGASSIKDLMSNSAIQAAISFGDKALDEINEDVKKIEESSIKLPGEEEYESTIIDHTPAETPEVDKTSELVTAEPKVTVVEPIQKEAVQEEQGIDITEANLAPIFGSAKEDEEIELPKAAEPVQTVETPVEEPTVADGTTKKIPLEVVNENKVLTFDEDLESTLKQGVSEIMAQEAVASKPVVDAAPTIEIPTIEAAPAVPTSPTIEIPTMAIEQAVAPEVPAAQVAEPVISEEPVIAEAAPIVDMPIAPAVAEVQAAPVQEEQPAVVEQAPVVEEQPVVPAQEEIKPETIAAVEEAVANMSTIEVPTIDLETVQKEVQEQVAVPTEPVQEPVQQVEAPTPDILSEISAVTGTENVEEDDDILSAITKNNSEINGNGNLTPEETLAFLTQGAETKAPAQSSAEESLETVLKNEDGTPVVRDGREYKFADFLSDNNVYETIPADSRVYLKDTTQTDSVDGITFINDYVYKHAVNGNRSFEDILDRYAKKIVKSNQEVVEFPEEGKKRGLFGIFKK